MEILRDPYKNTDYWIPFPAILISLVSGVTWALEFLKVPQKIPTLTSLGTTALGRFHIAPGK